MRRTLFVAAALAAITVLGGIPAGAEQDALVTDAAGDANGLNSQGNVATGPSGPDTRPASSDSVDLREVTARTAYSTTKVLDAEGKVLGVTYQPTALEFVITMEGNVLPNPGPSMVVRIPTRVIRPGGGVCETWFQAWWRGSNPLAEDQERADIRRLSAAPACPAVNTISAGFSQTVAGKTVVMRFPLAAANMAGFIENGTTIDTPPAYINSNGYIYIRPAPALVPTIPSVTTGPVILTSGSIDEADQFPGFVVGSDVPENVNCTVTPSHPDCAA